MRSSSPIEWGLPAPWDGAAVVVVDTIAPFEAVTVVTVEPSAWVIVVVVFAALPGAPPLDPLDPVVVEPVIAVLLAAA